MKIEKGFTIWAKQACESKIFLEKPDHWFKVWFYIVSRVNFKDNGKFKRGQGLFTYSELASILIPKKSRSVIDRIMRWLKADDMLTTHKTTRGLVITVNNYDKYQSSSNYTDDTRNHSQTIARRQPDDTIQKEEKERRININTCPDGQAFINHFNTEAGEKSYTLTDTRKKLLSLRRKTFSLEQIQKAVTNMFSNDFYSGINDRKWVAAPDFILRNDEQIDKFLNISVKKKQEYIKL